MSRNSGEFTADPRSDGTNTAAAVTAVTAVVALLLLLLLLILTDSREVSTVMGRTKAIGPRPSLCRGNKMSSRDLKLDKANRGK
jgi:hypothetical protein